jgi:hypothetical protein
MVNWGQPQAKRDISQREILEKDERSKIATACQGQYM